MTKKNRKIAVCVGCGCTDDAGCPVDPETGLSCTWLKVDYDAKVGICSRCASKVNSEQFKTLVAEHKMKYPVKKVHGYVNKLQDRREFLSREKRKEGRVE